MLRGEDLPLPTEMIPAGAGRGRLGIRMRSKDTRGRCAGTRGQRTWPPTLTGWRDVPYPTQGRAMTRAALRRADCSPGAVATRCTAG